MLQCWPPFNLDQVARWLVFLNPACVCGPLLPVLQPGLASWSGSSMSDVLAAQAALHVPLCLVPQPTCYTDGLGLEAWQFEDRVSSNTKVHFASQRPPQQGFYGVSSAR